MNTKKTDQDTLAILARREAFIKRLLSDREMEHLNGGARAPQMCLTIAAGPKPCLSIAADPKPCLSISPVPQICLSIIPPDDIIGS